MRRGFSLVEVVIAVGIVATAIVSALALLPSLLQQSTETADLYTAQRLSGSVRTALIEQSRAHGFVAFGAVIPEMRSPLTEGWALVGTSDGMRLAAPASGMIAQDKQHFLIEAWRFPDGPLRFDSNATVLPLHIRVTWPYHVRGVEEATSLSHRSQFSFNVALDR